MIGNKLKVARTASGLSLRALAGAMDGVFSAQVIGKYKRNEDMPGSRVLIVLGNGQSWRWGHPSTQPFVAPLRFRHGGFAGHLRQSRLSHRASSRSGT